MKLTRWIWAIPVAVGGGVLLASLAQGPESPEAVARVFLGRLRGEDYEAAFGMLHGQTRKIIETPQHLAPMAQEFGRGEPPDGFRADGRDEPAGTVRVLFRYGPWKSRPTGGRIRAQATLVMVREAGRWCVREPEPGAYALRWWGPYRLLRAPYREARRAQDWVALLRLLSPRYRAELLGAEASPERLAQVTAAADGRLGEFREVDPLFTHLERSGSGVAFDVRLFFAAHDDGNEVRTWVIRRVSFVDRDGEWLIDGEKETRRFDPRTLDKPAPQGAAGGADPTGEPELGP